MDNCCLNISGLGLFEGQIVYELNSAIYGEYPDFYFDSPDGILHISYDEEIQQWYLYDQDLELAQATYDGDPYCFDGLIFEAQIDKAVVYTFTVYRIPCDFTPTPPTIEYPEECLQEACRNKNLFNKHKRMLAEDIASISKKEIFGFKCGDAWENIFMRNMIIHALSCMPTGVLSIEKENCLIGKLTDKCNC